MESWELALQTYFFNNLIEASSVSFPDDADFATVTEALQPYMVASNPAVRTRAGILFKNAFLTYKGHLNESSLNLVKKFVESKLEDAAMVVEALAVVSSLSMDGDLDGKYLADLCIRALLLIKSNRYGVENRQSIFKFVLHVFQSHQASEVFLEKGSEFFEAYLNAITNEKDPRNLFIVFETIPSLTKLETWANFFEEVFESVACYFPITFKSNSNDPKFMTVDELKGSLRRSIACCREFGDLAVPLMIEKLSSTHSSAKIDSLELLKECVVVYDAESFTQFQFQLEIALFSEITMNHDSSIQQMAVQAVNSLCRKLHGREKESWIDKFVRESLSAIELDSREIMSKAAVCIEAIASADEGSFRLVVDSALQKLITIAKEQGSIKSQAARNCLVALLSPLKLNPNWTSIVSSQQAPIEEFFKSFNENSKDGIGVYLVIFSFVSSVVSEESSKSFVERLLRICPVNLSNELKNCLWLASKSCPSAFSSFVSKMESSDLLVAISSIATVTRLTVIRSMEIQDTNAINCILSNSDLSEITKSDDLVSRISLLEVGAVAFIRIVSQSSDFIQKQCLVQSKRMSEAIVACKPSNIENYDEIIRSNCENLEPFAITSLYNKCPEIWKPRINEISRMKPEFLVSAAKGLIVRMDYDGLSLLKENFEDISVESASKLFDAQLDDAFTSTITWHSRKALHLQWFISTFLQTSLDAEDLVALILLFSALCCASKSLASQYQLEIFNSSLRLISSSSQQIQTNILKCAWENVLDGLKDLDFDIEKLIQTCLQHSTINQEPCSLLRHLALKVISRLVEIPETRELCLPHQEKVVKFMSSNCLCDPKRPVRHEAAKANNLWHALKENVF